MHVYFSTSIILLLCFVHCSYVYLILWENSWEAGRCAISRINFAKFHTATEADMRANVVLNKRLFDIWIISICIFNNGNSISSLANYDNFPILFEQLYVLLENRIKKKGTKRSPLSLRWVWTFESLLKMWNI